MNIMHSNLRLIIYTKMFIAHFYWAFFMAYFKRSRGFEELNLDF